MLAAKAAEMSLIDFAFKTTLPISITAILGMGVAHFFWQRYLDKKENVSHEMMDVSEITTTAPAFYSILPFTPIIGVLIFDGKWGPQLHIITILVICMLLAAILEFVRGFNTQKVFTGLEVAFRGMADAFAGVVMLLVAAGCLPRAEHHRLYSEPDLYRHLVRLGQHYPDAGAGGADHAGGDDHRLR